ncbi:MAG: radical SAM family heme chaperone HemW [Endomicrobia bacterium]|nr:radical SAM family heme chaperone HemW [Endomicrobiia bacterium]
MEYNKDLSNRYISALAAHSNLYKDVKVNTVYIGGGTPSILSEKQIEKLLNSIQSNFNLDELKEFTFELNPESVTNEKLKILKDCGVGRLSMGLQSADDDLLMKIGRAHTFKTFACAYEAARKEDFDNFNIDLIYGLPGQSLPAWEKSLQAAVEFGCEHISLYPLSIEEGTQFYNAGICVDDSLQRDMYETAVKFLSSKSFKHYEISNWAKPGKDSVHNSNYWRNFEYIALGAGASGYENRFRYSNIENIGKYIDLISKKLSVKEDNDFIDEASYEAEMIMLGLRLLNEGVNINEFKTLSNKNALNKLIAQNLLINENGKIKLPKNAVFISNQIISEFMG